MTLGKFFSLSNTNASSNSHPLDPLQLLLLDESSCREVEVEFCSQVLSDGSRGNGLKLCQGRFSLDVKKKLFIKRVVRPWQRLHRAVVELPSLEGFKRYMDVALVDMV